MTDESTKDLTCDVADKPERTGAAATRSNNLGVSSHPQEPMRDEDPHHNSSDVAQLADQIETVDVDDPEDVDREDLEAIERRIAEIEEIDFSETIPPQRELLKFEISVLQAVLEGVEADSHKSITGGDADE